MRRSAQVFIACALFSFCSFAQNSFSTYQSKATAQKLWDDPYWHKLLHYEKKIFGGYESQVDAHLFFLSKDGKTNPKNELLTDVEELFTPLSKYPNPNDHPACKFPFRYEWLRQRLSVDVPTHDQLECPDFSIWKKTLGVNGVSLIFASSYTNNPASMFGHTFLRMHRVQNGAELPDMLHYTVNFAADTGSEGGILYSIKGLFGFYPGYFSTYPYYVKIKQYNNFESRDMWEYKLNLTQDQIEKMIFHLWEMRSAYFDYYFGDENCSYFLLSLLEMTNDDVYLRKHLPFFTIPMDTLKLVKNYTPWIGPVFYRASLRQRYKTAFGKFNANERKVFNDVAEKKITDTLQTIPPESQAKVIDTAIDFITMKEKTETKTDFQKKLLSVRSEIPIPYDAPTVVQPPNPLTSHPTVRAGAGGSRIAGENFAHVDFRGVYHDLLDDPAGFDPSAQIQSMEGRIRLGMKSHDVSLDHLKMIEVVSLNPMEKYLSKMSWNVGFGWRKNYSDECFDCGSFYLEGGPGFTLGTSDNRRIYFTVFGNGFFQAGPWNQTGYQIGPSGTSMLVFDLSHRIRLMASGNARYSPLGSPNFIYKGSLESSLELFKTWSMRGWANLYSESHEFGGSLLYYF